MFRKFINNYDFDSIDKEIPILNWQCITLRFNQKRSEDLMIDNEKHMMLLIEFLLYEINSVDGCRKSAKNILKNITEG